MYVLCVTCLLVILTLNFATRTDYGYLLCKYSHGTANTRVEENPAASGEAGCGAGFNSSAERESVLAVSTAAGAFTFARGARAPHHHGGGPWDMDKLTAALQAASSGLLAQGSDLFS